MSAETKHARSGDLRIAYQVTGRGRPDFVLLPGFVSHLEHAWQEPAQAGFLRRLGSFCRLIRFDKRGSGLSDRPAEAPTPEQRLDDALAVMAAVGSERATLFGFSEGGPVAIRFAATYPERTSGLVLYGTYPRRAWAPDYPWGRTDAEFAQIASGIERDWGGPASLNLWAPSMADDERFKDWFAEYLRRATSPAAALATLRLARQLDVRHLLPAVRAPTLIVHRAGDRIARVEQARYLAERIPGARCVVLAGDDHLFYVGDSEAVLAEIERFLAGL